PERLAGNGLAAWKVADRSGFPSELIERWNIEPHGIRHASIPFQNRDDAAAIFLGKIVGRMVTHVSESLYRNGLPAQTCRQTEFRHVLGALECLANAVLHPTSCGFASSADAALRNGLTSAACQVINSAGMKRVVGIGHPRHLAFAGANVGTGHVLAGPDETFLDQFRRVAACDLLDMLRGIFFRVESNAALGSA